MKTFNEIKKIGDKLFPYEISLSCGGGYFIGVKKMIENSDSKLQVLTATRCITVYGNKIKIVKLVDGDLAFLGIVEKIELEVL